MSEATLTATIPLTGHHPGAAPPGKRLRLAIGFSFFLAGAAGLIYAMVWSRHLAIFLGSTSLSRSITLAAFLAGLAAGGWVLGRIADHLAHPLRAFALLELGIGCYGIFYPGLLSVLEWGHRQAVEEVGIRGAADLALKLGLAAAILIPPTFLMGGALPLLGRFLARQSDAAAAVSLLYGVNGLGAVLGTLLVSFVLIPDMGLETSTIFAVGTSVLSGAVALVAGWRLDLDFDHEAEAVAYPARARRCVAEAGPLGSGDRILLWGITACGLAGMAMEMAWLRYFAGTLGPSSHTFTVVVAASFTGVSLGSLAAARWMGRFRDLRILFGAAALLIAATVIVPLLGYERLPFWLWQSSEILKRTEEAYPLQVAANFVFAFFILSYPTFFFGLALPTVTAQLARGGRLGAHIGLVYAGNAVGMSAGALAAGLYLLPQLGIDWTLKAGALLTLAAALIMLLKKDPPPASWQAPAKMGSRRKLAFAACAALAVIAAVLPASDPRLMALGLYHRNETPPQTFPAYRASLLDQRVVFSGEEAEAGVMVLESPDGTASLVVNGRLEASTGADLPLHLIAGHIPMVLHADPRDVLVLGISSGITAGSVLTHRPSAPVDCVEPSPAMVAAARRFADSNGGALEDPGLHLVAEDPRSFMRTASRSYDVIISRPQSSWVAGAGNLYSANFYRDCLLRLRESGLMVQVIHTQDVSDDLVRVLVRTFWKSFPHVYAWNSGGLRSDFILLGSRAPIAADFDRWKRRIEKPPVLADLARARIGGLSAFLALQSHSPATLALFTGEGRVNSDDSPHLEDRAPRAFFALRRSEALARLDERRGPGERLFLRDYLKAAPPSPWEFRSVANLFQGGALENPAMLFAALREYLDRAPGDAEAWAVYADELVRAGRPQVALAVLERAREETRGDPSTELKLLRREIEALRPIEREELTVISAGAAFRRSRERLERCIGLDPRGHDFYYTELARLSVFQGDRPGTGRWAASALRYRRENPGKGSPEVNEEELEFLKRWAAGSGN